MKLTIAVLFTLFATGVTAGAQSSKEEEKKTKKESPLAALAKKTNKGSSTKVIRADDLRKAKSRVNIPPARSDSQESAGEGGGSAAAEGEAAPEGGEEQSPSDERAEQQSQLQQQIQEQRELIQRLQAQNEEAQAQLSDQRTYYPGNPRRTQLMERIESNNAQIAEANRTIAELQSQARRAGVAVR